MDIISSDIYKILKGIKVLQATSVTVSHKTDECWYSCVHHLQLLRIYDTHATYFTALLKNDPHFSDVLWLLFITWNTTQGFV